MEDVDFDEEPVAAAAAARGGRKMDSAGRKVKGRGAVSGEDDGRYAGKGGEFESLPDTGTGPGPQKSVEGWIIMATGVHEEAQEEDLYDHFSQYGEIKNLQLPLDRRTGFIKGYALVEYEDRAHAQDAIEKSNGGELLGSTLTVDWAFSKGPYNRRTSTRRRTDQ